MAHFDNEYFDEAKFKKEMLNLDEAVAKFEEAISKLQEEGFITSYQSIMQLSEFSDNDFLNHVKGLFSKYVDSLGFVIKSERKRIAVLYDTMYTNSLPYIQSIRNAFSKGLIIKELKDGSIRIERKKMEMEAKKRSTIIVDVDLMREYYSLIMNIKNAMMKASEFEKKHGLYLFSDAISKLMYLNPHYPDFICELTLPQYFKNGDLSEEYFQKMMRQFFKKGNLNEQERQK